MIDKEKQWALAIEQANTSIQVTLKNALLSESSKALVKLQVQKIIDEMINELKAKDAPQELITKASNSAKMRFVEWYNLVMVQLQKEALRTKNAMLYKTYSSITGQELKPTKAMTIEMSDKNALAVEGSVHNVENYVTTQEHAAGQAYMDDYVNSVKKSIKTISTKNLILRDKNGRSMSLRNLAEMTARYEETKNRLNQLKEKGVEYVVASSHANASKRCQIWQGRVFIMDVDPNSTFKQNVDLSYVPTPIGKIDNIDYYSLKDAMLHGFLGYNCRHRLIKYTKGMNLFREYPASQIERERKLELKQRSFERNIRLAKKNSMLAVTKEDRHKWTTVSKQLQNDYSKFCDKNNLTRMEWRTRITREERLGVVNTKIALEYEKYFEEHIDELNVKINNGTIKVDEISDLKYFDDNCNIRDQYHQEILELNDKLSSMNCALEEKARFAFESRNQIRAAAREKMTDIKARMFLTVVESRINDFEEFINLKMEKKKISYDEALARTIKTAVSTNDLFDNLFIKGGNK